MSRVLRRGSPTKPFSTIIVPGLRTSIQYWKEFNHMPRENIYMFNYQSKGVVRNALSFFRDRTWLSRLRKSKRARQVADMIGEFLNQMKRSAPNAYILIYCHSHGCVITHRALEILAKRFGKKLPIKVVALAPPMFIPKHFGWFQLRGAINYINEQDWIWNLHTKTTRNRTGFTTVGLKPTLDRVPRNKPFLLHSGPKRRTIIVIRSVDRIPTSYRTAARSHYLGAYVDIRSNPRRVMMTTPTTFVEDNQPALKSHPLNLKNENVIMKTPEAKIKTKRTRNTPSVNATPIQRKRLRSG